MLLKYVLIMIVTVNGTSKDYAIDTNMSGEDCIERLEDFYSPDPTGTVKFLCRVDEAFL